RDAGVRQALLEILAKLQIAMQSLRIVLSCEPARVPRFVESEPESVRVDLLTQSCLRYFAAALRARRFAAGFFAAGLLAGGGGAAGAAAVSPLRAFTALTSSDTCTVTCAFRF